MQGYGEWACPYDIAINHNDNHTAKKSLKKTQLNSRNAQLVMNHYDVPLQQEQKSMSTVIQLHPLNNRVTINLAYLGLCLGCSGLFSPFGLVTRMAT